MAPDYYSSRSALISAGRCEYTLVFHITVLTSFVAASRQAGRQSSKNEWARDHLQAIIILIRMARARKARTSAAAAAHMMCACG
jgi:hypothetical protein